MKNIKNEVVIWGQLLIFIAIWSAVLLLSDTPLNINLEALKKLPDVVTIYAVLLFIFTKWLWRIPQLQGWLVPFPDLQGTWEGVLKSTWVHPKTQKSSPAIHMILVIRQNFDSINCVMYTKESMSNSLSASFFTEQGNEIRKLSYVFSSRPEASIRDRSPLHDGAVILQIITKPTKKLEGEYWTNRKTSGSLSFKFKSNQLLECYPE